MRTGTMTPEVLGAVRAAIEKNENILISGGTSTRNPKMAYAIALRIKPAPKQFDAQPQSDRV